MDLDKKTKVLVAKFKKVKKARENLTNVFTLRCEVCGSTKTRYDGKDFELWDRELWDKEHYHKIRRFLRI